LKRGSVEYARLRRKAAMITYRGFGKRIPGALQG
jgi:hypothetical protein